MQDYTAKAYLLKNARTHDIIAGFEDRDAARKVHQKTPGTYIHYLEPQYTQVADPHSPKYTVIKKTHNEYEAEIEACENPVLDDVPKEEVLKFCRSKDKTYSNNMYSILNQDDYYENPTKATLYRINLANWYRAHRED